ncbi:MAG TPA: acyltransferase [Gemmatimonadaceae bacterium]|nr:acyltransferase [Gemmatimonadaceae bacterium]
MTTSKKLNGLEVLRFVAAFAVVVWHYQHFYYLSAVPVGFDVTRQPFFQILRPFYVHGLNGVEVFWCLSGFIFFWKYAALIHFRRISAQRFAWLRFTRLYPLHFVTLIAVAVLQPIYEANTGSFFVYQDNDRRDFLLNLLFASKWGLEHGLSFNGPVWSVSLEVIVYALFFVVSRFLGVSFGRAIIIAFAALYFVIPSESRMILQSAVLCFYVGGAIALLSARMAQWKMPLGVQSIIVLVVAGLAMAWLASFKGAERFIVIIGSSTAILLFFLFDAHLSGRVFSRLAGIGNLTYASYMLHFPIQLATVTILGPDAVHRLVSHRGFFLYYVVTTFALAYVAYHLFELPVQNFLRRRYQFGASLRTETGPREVVAEV